MIFGKDRLTAVAQGDPCDRIPVFCNLLDQGAKEIGISLREYYSAGECVAEGQLRMRERYGYDNLWCLFYVGKEAEMLGCEEIVFSEMGPPNVGQLILRDADDIHRLEVPDELDDLPAFQEPRKCLDILRHEAAGKYPICAYVTASMTLPAILMGMERWMDLLFNGPTELRDELLEKCSAFVQKELATYRAAGVDVLLYADPFASTDFVSMKFIQEHSLPWLERDLLPGGMEGVVFYCGGARMSTVIEQVFARTKIGVYYLGPMDDIAQCKWSLGGRALSAGVINDIKLIDWSPQQVREEVRRILDVGMPGGKFFFGTVVMPYAIPEANIRAMLDAAYEYGRLAAQNE